MVGTEAFVGIIIQTAVCVLLPVVILIFWRKKTKANLIPAVAGAVTFFLFAMVLERIPVYFLFAQENAASAYINAHPWAYALIGAGLAGIFEETGRYLAFRLPLRKYRQPVDSITYGIGHGGIEAILIIGIMGVEYLVFAAMINNGTFDSLYTAYEAAGQGAAAKEQLDAIRTELTGYKLSDLSWLLVIIERILTMTLHISFSVLVFRSVQKKGCGWMYPLAVLLHTLADIGAAMYQTGTIENMALVEGMLFVFTLITAGIAAVVWRSMKRPDGLSE